MVAPNIIMSPTARTSEVGTNAAVISRLTDGTNVFYDDFGDRFYLPDGSYNHDYWNGPAGAGAQPPAYEVLAKALEPWIDRFVL